MKRLATYLSLVLLLLVSWSMQAQSVEELEQQLQSASSDKEKMALNYQLGEAYLRTDTDKALEASKRAFELALNQGNNNMAASSAYLRARAYARDRNKRNQEVWLRTALEYAKKASDSDLIIKSVNERSKLAMRERNYRKAYEINQEAFDYFSQSGNSIGELEAKSEVRKANITRQYRELERQREALAEEIEILREEQDLLDDENSKLVNTNRQKSEQLRTKDKELTTIAEEKQAVENLVKAKEKQVKTLSREALEKQAAVDQAQREIAERDLAIMEADLAAEESRNQRNLLIGAAGILLLLALLLYTRFHAKRKTANSLKEKNTQIEEERKRSDELLLNILPASIAGELKQFGKAKARKFDEVTVLFSDFKNFTLISEQLSPEELVEELDKCFKAFDFIIGSYPDIEKIKTIGDAYMCASGLSERRTLPTNMVRAALEMQAFLEEQRQERSRLGKPYFEARIGLHTGPVVAGVVGVKKFAYDIWGDTVNLAARVESNSQAGRVNISETTYNLIRYQFECTYRGKVQAKNKGAIDMYYVEREKAASSAASAPRTAQVSG